MSISHQLSGGFMLDHDIYVSAVYRRVSCPDGRFTDFALLPGLFNITRPFRIKMERNRKRKSHSTEDDALNKEVTLLKDLIQTFLEKLKQKLQDKLSSGEVEDDSDAKELSKKIFEGTNFDFGSMQGGNNSTTPLKCRIGNEFYLIPPMSRFLCGNVVEQVEKLRDVKFELVVADPPWWNKYIRRLKVANPRLSYSMMYNHEIASIPLAPILADGSLVAVWCTNSPTNVRAVREVIFPSWGVMYAATWYWLKVTKRLEPVCSFSASSMKQPYERIILGTVGRARSIPDGQIIVSVPSALHSHKPPLIEVLSPYVEEHRPRALELFARYLLPNTTSIGYEPLKWQHTSLYTSNIIHNETTTV